MTYPTTRSQVATLANTLRNQKDFSLSDAFKQAWKVIKAKIAMKAGKLAFSYIKKDGTLRPAIGTTSPTLTGYANKTKGRNYNPLYVRYFDMTAGGFRQFSAETFTRTFAA